LIQVTIGMPMPDIDWEELSKARYAAYLAGAYQDDPTGTLSFTNYVLDPTGFVGSKLDENVHANITLDPATLDRGPVLSNGNLTLTGTNGFGTAAATGPGWKSGKLYLEITATTATDLVIVGLGEAAAIHRLPGNGDNPSNGYWSFGGAPVGAPSFTSGDVIGMAVNMDTGTGGLVRAFFRKNATWINDPTTDPGIAIAGLTPLGTPVWPLFFVNPGMALTVNFGASAFAHTAPTGYSAWVTSATAASITVAQSLPLQQAAAATHPDIATVFQTLPAEQQTAIARMLTLQPSQALGALVQAATGTYPVTATSPETLPPIEQAGVAYHGP
jgi:hypothetical protein